MEQSYAHDNVDLNLDWVHDKFDDTRDGRPSHGSNRYHRSASAERGGPALTKVRVSNLHYDITESDLKGLFGEIGPVSNLEILYDRAGRSEGVALVTYTYLRDAKRSVEEFHKANAKGQPIYLSLVRDAPERSSRTSLFDRIERPRDARSLSPGGDDGERRNARGRGRRSDTTRPAPDHIDRYVPGNRSPAATVVPAAEGVPQCTPRKTQEELDQEMEDYWGGNAGGDAEKQPEPAAPVAAADAVPAVPATVDDDIDMIE
ncbi:RNA binding domain protein [Penicillium chermesinum]|uniref:RNA binding domain protein n=1 Tax=Penicillium chermesinum TaxID=63820 RepID=A0A9W9TRX0_9EURO|nr:RNA binding domain protein [Penicillium chermesinum]KAJ5238927.1 RNA binding domain protein [Penicillium chermesinum]